MIVMIKTMNVNMEVAAENPGGKKVVGHFKTLKTKNICNVKKGGHVLRH